MTDKFSRALDTLSGLIYSSTPLQKNAGKQLMEAAVVAPGTKPDAEVLGVALREAGLELCVRVLDPSSPPVFGAGPSDANAPGNRYLDLLLALSEDGSDDPKVRALLFSMMDELLESLPAKEGEMVFEWLADRYSHNDKLLERCSANKMPLLKLSRRVTTELATEVDASYKGRVALLMAKLLPINDRSTINVNGVVNTSHVPRAEPRPEPPAVPSTPAPQPEAAEGTVPPDTKDKGKEGSKSAGPSHRGTPIPASTPGPQPAGTQGGAAAAGPEGFNEQSYQNFWALQEYLTDPGLCYQHPPPPAGSVAPLGPSEHMATALELLRSVLTDFEANPIEGGTEGSIDPTYSLRYLTGRTLFPWQLRDASHRRRVLFQALVLLQYLELPRSSGKAKTPSEEKSAQLKPKQKEDVERCRERCYRLLRKCDPDFLRSVQRVLAREAIFVAWKKEEQLKTQDRSGGSQCCWVLPQKDRAVLPHRDPTKPSPSAAKPLRSKPRKEEEDEDEDDEERRRRRALRISLGDKSLDEFWNLQSDNLSDLRADERGHRRSLDYMVRQVAESMDSGPQGTAASKALDEVLDLNKSKVFAWRFARAHSRRDATTVSSKQGYPSSLERITYEHFPTVLKESVSESTFAQWKEKFEREKMEEEERAKKRKKEKKPDPEETPGMKTEPRENVAVEATPAAVKREEGEEVGEGAAPAIEETLKATVGEKRPRDTEESGDQEGTHEEKKAKVE